MKLTVNIIRILVGLLFVFSGFIKAIDPLGLAYKMQEFFEAWAGDRMSPTGIMHWFHEHALMLAVLMNTLEVALGVALLIGWQRKVTTWFLLLLMIFFLFLTSYVLFSGKIRTCGCFGDCIPLTPIQTFTKDVILLVLIIFLLLKRQYILPIVRGVHLVTLLLLGIMFAALIQSNALGHLPMIDCLPFKKGNNILELRKMPADATFDQVEYSFIYKKGDQQKEFPASALPDSSWQYVDRKSNVVKKGNGKLPVINDFSLSDMNGNDSTEAILSQSGEYYLFFMKNFGEARDNWRPAFDKLWQSAKQQNRNIYIVTADTDSTNTYFNKVKNYNVPVLTCDQTAIKTAARVNPTVYLMKGPIVQGKWAWADIDDAIKK